MYIFVYLQNSKKIDKQYDKIKEMNIDDKNIYIDKEFGKDFDRTNHQKLIKQLKKTTY